MAHGNGCIMLLQKLKMFFMCANYQSPVHFWCGYGVLDTEGKFAAFLLGPASRNVTDMPNTPDALP